MVKIADRSVSVRLRLRIKEFEAGSNGIKKNLTGLNKKFAQTAGFAAGFRKKLEDATKKLPKIDIDANSSPADVKIAELRSKLEKLSGKEIGVDIDASQALIEMATLQRELEGLGDGASFEVRADISKALTDLNAVTREVERLDGQKVEIDIEADKTFADRLRAQVELAARSLPKIQIDADSTPAQAKIADLRARLTAIASKRVGIDVDAGSAMAEISAIQRELSGLTKSADIDVRVDAGSALAELSAISGEVSRVDGRTASLKVNADVGGALTAIAAVGAALAGIPAVTSVAVAVGVLGSAFTAAGAGAAGFAAVAIPSLGRINEALNQTKSAAGGAGGAMKSAAQKAAEAAATSLRLAEAQDRVADSAQKVKDAQRGVKEALAGVKEAQQSVARAQTDVAQAVQDAAYRHAEALRQVADAERSVQDAQRSALRAQQDLNDARKEAARDAQDLASRLSGAQIDMREATLDVTDAEKRLNAVRANPNSTAADIERAQIAYDRARQRVSDLTTQISRLSEQQAEFARTGVEGTKRVQDAKESLAAAQQRILDAERSAADARANVARTDEESARRVADAQRGVADAQKGVAEANLRVLDAQRKVVEAQRDAIRAAQRLKVEQLQAKAALDAAAKSAGGGGGAASKMAELSKAERELAEDIKKFKDAYIEWQRELQPDVFPAIRSGMDLLETGWKTSTPLVKASSKAIDEFLKKANGELKSQQWQSFFAALTEEAPRAIGGLGNAALNVAGGLSGVIQAFLPYTDDLMTFLEDATQGFEDWGRNLKGSPEFEAFIAYVKEQGPKVGEILGNIAEFAGNIFKAGADAGPGVLDFLVGLSEKLAGMDSAQIEAVAKGVGLIFAAVKLGATLKISALVLLADVLSKMSPGQIQALAVAIGATIVAVKGYQAVTGAAEFFKGLSGSIDGAGKSADGAKGKLANLAGLIGKGGVIAAAAAGTVLAVDSVTDSLDGLNPNINELTKQLGAFGRGGEPAAALLDQLDPKMQSLTGRFESFGDSAARLTSNNSLIAFGNQLSGLIDDNLGVELDGGRQGIDNLDQALSTMVANGNGDEAAAAFNRLAKQAVDAGTPVDRLKELFPLYASSVDGALPKTDDMATALGTLGIKVDPTAVAMERFNASLDIFNAKTDVAARALELKDAFDQAKKAIAEAGGKLEFTAGMTDLQKEAIIRARDQFAGYIEKVQAAARAAGELAGKTGEAATKSDEAKEAVLRQLEPLLQLAGKNSEARTQVLKLAEAYGISERDAKKAAKGGADLEEVLNRLKNKNIYLKLGLDTTAAQEAFERFVKRIGNRSYAVALVQKGQAAGGIDRYAAGGIDYAAAAGMQVRPQPPGVVSKPTVLYGEGSSGAGATEAYIPYEGQFRGRAVELLGQVADDFGFALYGKSAAQQVAQVAVTVSDASTQLGAGLGMGTSALTDAFGATGSLTGSITKVGSSADQLNQAWLAGSQIIGDTVGVMGTVTSDAVTVMTSSIDTLSVSVADLGSVLSAAAEMTSSTSTGGGSTSKAKAKSKGKPGAVDATAKKSTAPRKGGLIAGSEPVDMIGGFNAGGFTTGSSGLSMGSPVNTSRVSAPQQVSSSSYAPAPSAGGGIATASSGGGSAAGSVTVQGDLVVNSRADADYMAERLYFKQTSRG